MDAGKRLTKSRNFRIAGVCGGIAEFLGWSAGATRLLWVLITIATGVGPGVVAYLLLAAIMPPPPPDEQRFDLDRFRVQ